jgi:hypothetical protein
MCRVTDFAFVIFEVASIYLLFCLIAYFAKIELGTGRFEPTGLWCIVWFRFYQKLTRSNH